MKVDLISCFFNDVCEILFFVWPLQGIEKDARPFEEEGQACWYAAALAGLLVNDQKGLSM